ncbi:hypothetical protein BO82DRAFT_365347 [Aspergillus uvarum CBS 121591]|uniref:Uncharacterized protein n=1 Tax=Aspergillus uvarum CBS 121591 TaxID=1448315 RepID=A0A319C745_9EURO|nr:hypothetical protein BO82DRAFT_365347 [Aspergillus uvarum CBS 121591]PYH81175.1 hypothetical protein BO82DRAFT_365347 [Aspergillus uvarum CBS 121591]
MANSNFLGIVLRFALLYLWFIPAFRVFLLVHTSTDRFLHLSIYLDALQSNHVFDRPPSGNISSSPTESTRAGCGTAWYISKTKDMRSLNSRVSPFRDKLNQESLNPFGRQRNIELLEECVRRLRLQGYDVDLEMAKRQFWCMASGTRSSNMTKPSSRGFTKPAAPLSHHLATDPDSVRRHARLDQPQAWFWACTSLARARPQTPTG